MPYLLQTSNLIIKFYQDFLYVHVASSAETSKG
jgi:hypothetical protein